jgi:tRNA1Val (adenine37-N6)-methyltransferase
MPNNYFRFKQFMLRQDKCAMKVCTDACLFGAWVSVHYLPFPAHNVLDIGTGTGLLSLMLAQKLSNTVIDAVEIDGAAAHQAKENFESSSWRERLHVYNMPARQFSGTANHKYDLIISNPPFYESSLKSDDDKRNIALHSAELTLKELISIADELLNEEGNFFVLLPYYRTEEFSSLIAGKFFVKEKVFVKQSPKHNYSRSMIWLGKRDVASIQSEINIMNENNEYSNEFRRLLTDYYLKL